MTTVDLDGIGTIGFHLLVDDEVYEAKISTRAHPSRDGSDSRRYTCSVKPLGETTEDRLDISISGTAGAILSIPEGNIVCARCVFSLLREGKKKFEIHTGNASEILTGQDGDAKVIRGDILGYLYKRYEELSKPQITVIELMAAINRPPDKITEALRNLTTRNWIGPNSGLYDLISLKNMEYVPHGFDFMQNAINLHPAGQDYKSLFLEKQREARNSGTQSSSVLTHPYRHYKIVPIEADRYKGEFIFCMTEFKGASLERYEHVLSPLCFETVHMPALISRDDHLDYGIDHKIISHIHKCKFGIADISTRNPNVMYEIGFAHAVNKPVIIICDEKSRGDKEIFDIRNIPTIYFTGEDNLREELAKKIAAQLASFEQGSR